jgi:hypothetical protein
MMRAVYRYEVPVDDQWHEITMGVGIPVLHVAARQIDVVEFWAESRHSDSGWEWQTGPRWFRVFGTGQPLVESPMQHRGVTLAGAAGQVVWHLYESLSKP